MSKISLHDKIVKDFDLLDKIRLTFCLHDKYLIFMKVVLVGDTQVGKTSIVTRLKKGRFADHTTATVGAALQEYIVQTENGTVSMQIWDTAGQEKFRTLAPMYYRTANVAIIVYDITKAESFKSLETWTKELEEKGPQGLKICIVGNKSDLTEERAVSTSNAEDFAFARQASFFCEVSAKTGEGVVGLFEKIATLNEADARIQNTEPIEIIPTKPPQDSSCC